MIKKIVIRDVASFDHEGVTFDDLQKVNIVYGGNGTGKTTVSRYLKNLKDRIVFPNAEQYRYHHCNIELDGNLEDWNILVYNSDFKEENLKEDMPGIFTLGEDYVAYGEKFDKEYLPMVEAFQRNELSEEDQWRLYELHQELQGKFDIVKRYTPSVDTINSMLKERGYSNFSIQMSPTEEKCYQIQREDGSFVFNSLSEGETTFITFLYFMQVVNNPVEDEDAVKKKTFVVIDDPMSSLDAQAMDVVGSMVRQLFEKVRNAEETSEIQQVLVMTHNLEFLKQVAPRQKSKDTHHWRLMKKGSASNLIDFREKRPVSGGYEQLWEELKDASDTLDSTRLPNIMRSIIETYFVKFGGYNKRKLFNGDYVTRTEDKTVVESFCKWLDDGSHGGEEDLFAGDPQMKNERNMEKFRRFFMLMGQGEHYSMMMRVD